MYDLTSFEMLCIRNIVSVHYFVGDHGKCKYLVPFFGCFFFSDDWDHNCTEKWLPRALSSCLGRPLILSTSNV